MENISIQVLQGADRGKTFSHLSTPITVGREDGNTIQLNDERISRFHVKIQVDNDHLVLTDLDSTNGTQVNGHNCQLRIVRVGDMISLGRSVLLIGSPEEIAQRVESLTATGEPKESEGLSQDFELSSTLSQAVKHLRNAREDFKLPERLAASQSAQLSELLEHVSNRLANVINSAKLHEPSAVVKIDKVQWQMLLSLSSSIADMIRQIGDPNA